MMNGHGTVKDTMKAVKGVGTDDILAALGLERRGGAMSHVLPALGYFAAGLVVGTGVALLVAPKSGREMRRELGEKVRHVSHQIGSAAENVVHEAQNQLRGEEAPLRRTPSQGPGANARS